MARKIYYVYPKGTWSNGKITQEAINRGKGDECWDVLLKDGRDYRCLECGKDFMIEIEQSRRDNQGTEFELIFEVFVKDANDRIRNITAVVKRWRIKKGAGSSAT